MVVRFFLGALGAFFLLTLPLSPVRAADDAVALVEGGEAEEEVQELQVSRVGDLDMGCGQLSREAELMRDIITTTEDIKDETKMTSRGAAVAGAAASFLVGTVTGGVGLAAAGFLIDHQINERGEDADGVQDIAEQRRILMMGIYNAKGCAGPIEHVMQDGRTGKDDDGLLGFDVAGIEPAAGDESPSFHYNE